MKVTQNESDTQDLYNHIIGRLREETLTLVDEYLNYFHCALWYSLQKYINSEQRRIMENQPRISCWY